MWLAEGVPDIRVAILPRGEIDFTDGWHVQGLKGTGSYDYNVAGRLRARAPHLPALHPRAATAASAPTFRMGLMPITAAGHAGWALGVAKSMLDDVEELAETKVRMGDMAALVNRPSFQRGFAHHSSMWRAAQLLVLDAFEDGEAAVAAGGELTPDAARADMRVAAVYATDCSPRDRRVGPPGRRHRPPSARAAASSGPSATSTPAPSTPSSARRWPSTRAQVWLGLVDDQRGL